MKLAKLNMRKNLFSIASKKVLVNINKKLGRSGKTFVRTTSKKADFSRIHTVRTQAKELIKCAQRTLTARDFPHTVSGFGEVTSAEDVSADNKASRHTRVKKNSGTHGT